MILIPIYKKLICFYYIQKHSKTTFCKMGNRFSNTTTVPNQECLICWETIDNKKWTQCVRCKIKMHDYCEEVYRNEKEYTKCPHCQRKGSIGCYCKV
jgi:hypothetical protein